MVISADPKRVPYQNGVNLTLSLIVYSPRNILFPYFCFVHHSLTAYSPSFPYAFIVQLCILYSPFACAHHSESAQRSFTVHSSAVHKAFTIHSGFSLISFRTVKMEDLYLNLRTKNYEKVGVCFISKELVSLSIKQQTIHRILWNLSRK